VVGNQQVKALEETPAALSQFGMADFAPCVFESL